jgi:hypothetical protein
MEKKMKKLALSVILGASLALTSSAFALTSMTADNMKAATGQAGVSIAIDNVVVEQFIGATTYTDADGVTGVESGSISIANRHVIKQYNALTSMADFQTKFTAAAGVAPIVGAGTLPNNFTLAHALTIDVGTCSVLTAGGNANLSALVAKTGTAIADILTDASTKTVAALATQYGIPFQTANELKLASTQISAGVNQTVTGVVICLPTLMITTSADSYDVTVNQTGAANNGCKFINISKAKSVMAILGGTVEIAAH